MKELIHRLVSQADLTEEQAERVAQVVRDFLVEKLPDSIEAPVLAALSGKNVDGAADALRNAIGSIFGR